MQMASKPVRAEACRMIPTRQIRTLDFSAASGLLLRDGVFHVVGDDELALCVFSVDGDTRRITLLPGVLPEAHAERKAGKPDFEILIDLGDRRLLAMGSGSRASRERAVLIARDHSTTVIDTAPLCAALRATFPQLNLEGGVLRGDELVLLQRGNRSDHRNALVFVDGDDLWSALRTRRFETSRVPRIVELDLGQHEEVPWSGTDLAVLADDDLLASAVLEDTADAFADGACLGSALARIGADGTLRWLRRLDTKDKVEGIALDGQSIWLVTDADDRSLPSQLRYATLD